MALSFKQSLAYFWEQIGKQFVKNGTIDWAQNDETKSGYIKNRTHYIGFEETGKSFKNVHSDGLYNLTVGDPSNAIFPTPPGYYGYIGYVNASSKLFDESNEITGFKILWQDSSYYSRIVNGFDAKTIGFGNIDIFIKILEYSEGVTFPPELRDEIPEIAFGNVPFFGFMTYDPTDGIYLQLFTNENYGLYSPIEVFTLIGDGELKKLNNVFLDDSVVRTEQVDKEVVYIPSTTLAQIEYNLFGSSIELNEGFKANDYCIVNYNNHEYSCYVNQMTENGVTGYVFGALEGLNGLESLISSPNVPFVCIIESGSILVMTRDGASEVTISIYSGHLEPRWLVKEPNGTVHWEEKTHGIVKGTGQVIVPVREYTPEELEGLMFTQWPQLQEGARYSIICGTATWETVCSSVSDDGVKAYVLGDIYGIMNGQDGIISDPPILILQVPGGIDGGIYNIFEFDADFNIGDVLSGESIRFGITECGSIKKLDSKYIDWPDTIPLLSEKDGNVYLEIDNLEGTLNDFYNVYVYSIEGLENVSWEEGCYYTVKTDNNAALLQCMRYPGDIDTPGCWMLMDPFFGTVDGYAFRLLMNALEMSSCVVLYRDNTGVLLSKNTITSLTIQDKQTYLNKINKYAIPDRLPLMPGSGSDSLQTSNYDSQAYGVGSIALRRGSQAEGDGSLAIGNGSFYGTTRADGNFSIAINGGKAQGDSSIACARGTTTANALYALAYGKNAVAGSSYQIVLGSHNILDDSNTYGFIFGNGDGDIDSANCKCNAFTINWNGNVWAKNLYVGGTSDTEGASKVATEAYVNGLIVPPVLESTTGKENAAGPIGKYASGTPGMNSFTWGLDALAAGAGSIAMGTSSTASSSAHWGVAIGTYAASKGGGAVAIGQNVTASNENAVAIGHGATASSLHSIAIGNNLTANHNNQVVLGTYNVSANYSLLLGNGSGSGRSNAFGITNTGTGYFAGDLYVNGTGTSSTFSNAKKVATESYVDTKVAGLVDSAPTTLNTLNELAAALGDDPNFATTVATEIGKKADKTDLVALTEAEILEVCGVAAVAHISEVTW